MELTTAPAPAASLSEFRGHDTELHFCPRGTGQEVLRFFSPGEKKDFLAPAYPGTFH